VRDRVECDDAVERRVGEVEVEHVGAQELGRRDVPAGEGDLRLGEVHADDPEPLRQPPRGRDPGAAAEVEHRPRRRQERQELAQEPVARVALDVSAPRREPAAIAS
jgi:hypothetical protein